MTWNSGTATDRLDLLDQLVEIATSRHVATVAVNNGGSGYAVGDILSVAGGTASHTATIEVTSVSSGVIDGVRVNEGGAYTADPTTSGNSVTGGSGSGATMDLTMDDTGWTVNRRTQEAASAAVGTAGSGYSVSDQLSVSGGLQGHNGVTAVFNVDSVDGGGGVTGVSLVTAGNYEEVPANDASTTGGGGSGCELTVTWQDATSQEQVLIMTGTVSGTNPVVGVKTWQGQNVTGTDTTFNWSLFGMTAYNSGLEFQDQPDISPGLETDGAPEEDVPAGSIVPLKDQDAFNIEWWVSINGRRIVGVAKVESATTTHYMHFYLGHLNPLGITSELPYPLYVAGSTNRPQAAYDETAGPVAGLSEAIALSGGGSTGPGHAWSPAGEWVSFRNAEVFTDTDTTPTAGDRENIIYPLGTPNVPVDSEDEIVADTGGVDWQDVMFDDNAGAWEVFPSEGTERVLVPCVVLRADDQVSPEVYSQLGELDGVFWTSAANGESSEDFLSSGDDRYRIFQNGNRVRTYSFLALKED